MSGHPVESQDQRGKHRGVVSSTPKKTGSKVDNSEEALLKRRGRELRNGFEPNTWSAYRDTEDIFDLRYLYDDEEIMEMKNELIEYFDVSFNPWLYHRYYLHRYDEEEDDERHNDDSLYEAENREQVEYDFPVYEQEDDESWDVEENYWNVRFDMRRGFIIDEYDSGHDEPNRMRQPYPEDEEIDEEKERIANEQLERLLVELHYSRMHERELRAKRVKRERQLRA